MGGRSPFLLLGDHAGVAIPEGLGDLGVAPPDLARHIACDIGVAALGTELSARLDAAFIAQRYSRLVIDCNRALGSAGSIVAISDGTAIPGNQGLAPEAAASRALAVFRPYHDVIADTLDQRNTQGQTTVLLALHSFTPSMGGTARPWRYGVLHAHDSAVSLAVLKALRDRHGEAVGDNQPYAMDGTDFTVPFHAGPRGLDYLELEVRQDLIDTAPGVAAIAVELASVLLPIAASLNDV
jgi:predicted N-formylglutamate amidohydrolase